MLARLPESAVEWASRLAEAGERADHLVDALEAVAAQRSDSAAAEALDWSRALRECIASHRRDLDATRPWARRAAGEGNGPVELRPEAVEILKPLSDPSQTLSGLPSDPTRPRRT